MLRAPRLCTACTDILERPCLIGETIITLLWMHRYGSDEEVSDDEDWIQTFWSATGE